MSEPQTYATHRRREALQHYVLIPIFLITLGVAISLVVRHPNLHTVWMAVLALALLLLAFQVRLYSLKVQDRVIRLEETLRMARILPQELQGRIPELTVKQLVGLRFASDTELADRVREALDERLDGEAIKKRILAWRPDTFRV
jgi:hypothetical protein